MEPKIQGETEQRNQGIKEPGNQWIKASKNQDIKELNNREHNMAQQTSNKKAVNFHMNMHYSIYLC